jgi:signal transduction histidine kinase
LLVTVPVLLLGVYFTYRKSRSVFLETSRQNLTKSAVRKADSLKESIAALQSILVSSSETVVLKSGSPAQKQAFLEAINQQITHDNKCLQLIDISQQKLVANTCKFKTFPHFPLDIWPRKNYNSLNKSENIWIQSLLFVDDLEPLINARRLPLQFVSPIYDESGQLRYALSLQISMLDRRKVSANSLEGFPVIINESGVILAHPFLETVGKNIKDEDDAARLELVVSTAISGKERFLHLFSLGKDKRELIAGYSAIPSPLNKERGNKKWAILSISPIDEALAPLRDIRRILLYMVFALVGGSFLAILIIARELARPIEKLRDYALNYSNNNFSTRDRIPQNFSIREVNQLSDSLQTMINHIKAWGKEVESSWQEAQTANKLKTEFLATTSHELRTPLNGIINCVRIVKDGYCDSQEEVEDFLQKADDTALHLLGIINDLLEISRIESGKLSVTCEPVDLNMILKELINIQLIQIQRKKLQLIRNEQQENLLVYADPAKFKQVLINILGNAVKFTESGSITVTNTVNEAQAIITIQDTGIGIDPQHQSKLFRPFVMIDGSTTRRFSGTGLGLAISKNLMQLMGGSITLSSPGLGRGTTLEITIPLAERLPSNQVNGQGKNSLELLPFASF